MLWRNPLVTEAEKAAEETLALPIYPELTREQIGEVAKAVGDFCK